MIGCVLLSGSTVGFSAWRTKVFTVLSEFDVAAATTGADGEASGDHQVDGGADDERELASDLVHVAVGPVGPRAQPGPNRRWYGESGVPYLGGPRGTQKSRQDPSNGAAHEPRVHVCSFSLTTWSGKLVFFVQPRPTKFNSDICLESMKIFNGSSVRSSNCHLGVEGSNPGKKKVEENESRLLESVHVWSGQLWGGKFEKFGVWRNCRWILKVVGG